MLKQILHYVLSMFSAESSVSFGRWASLPTLATGCVTVLYLVFKNHALPDGSALAGLAVFMTAPYAVNRTTAAFNRSPDNPAATLGNLNASATPHHTRTRFTIDRDR